MVTTVKTPSASINRMVKPPVKRAHLKKAHLTLIKASILLLALATFSVVKEEIASPLLYQTLRGTTSYNPSSPSSNTHIYIPPSLDEDRARALSLNLGGGECKWEPPQYDVPADLNFHKTLVAGFPSGDKRMAYLQMEALTGFPAKDEWDFAHLGMSNHPFIKGNYPHHEGIWGWGLAADQVVMVVPNIRRSMVEYHDILWDLGYPLTWEEAQAGKVNLFQEQPGVGDYYEWRDSRVLDEVCWYGWFIDYWMEGGLMRDIFTHKITTKEHFQDLLLKPFYSRNDLAYENYIEDEASVVPAYDGHCANGEISGGCEPVVVISADKLLDYTEGPGETAAIATALMNDPRMGQYVIDQEAWDCIWNELIAARKGPIIMSDRPAYQAPDGHTYNFSHEMLAAMLEELDRLTTKYGSANWSSYPTAIRLVEILAGHRDAVQQELDELRTGVRRLTNKDYLGPSERAQRRQDRGMEQHDEERDMYFISLEQKRFDNKRQDVTGAVVEDVNENTLVNKKSRKKMSDKTFIRALSAALKKIGFLHKSGGMDRETAVELVERVREVAVEAQVVIGDESEDEDEEYIP